MKIHRHGRFSHPHRPAFGCTPLLYGAVVLVFTACSPGVPPDRLKAFAPLPAHFGKGGVAPDGKQVALGRRLYHETNLSLDRNLSCASCHPLSRFGADGEATSPGHLGKRGDRNSPTSLNAAGHLAQFWDGRAATVEDQALGPMMNPVEMAMPSMTVVLERLSKIQGYTESFVEAFPGLKPALTAEHVGAAIGAFERTLVTPGPFDRFLKGDGNALTREQKKGLLTFTDFACQACHDGALLGGGRFERAGAIYPWPTTNDVGRWAVTKKEEDRFVFKVPSLRNVARTGPYFHDGSVADLGKAVERMAWHQTGRRTTAEETKAMVAFLQSLTGEEKAF